MGGMSDPAEDMKGLTDLKISSRSGSSLSEVASVLACLTTDLLFYRLLATVQNSGESTAEKVPTLRQQLVRRLAALTVEVTSSSNQRSGITRQV